MSFSACSMGNDNCPTCGQEIPEEEEEIYSHSFELNGKIYACGKCGSNEHWRMELVMEEDKKTIKFINLTCIKCNPIE